MNRKHHHHTALPRSQSVYLHHFIVNYEYYLNIVVCEMQKKPAIFVASNRSKARSSANKTENEMNIVRIEIFFMNE